MSAQEMLQLLPELAAAERATLLKALFELEEQDVLRIGAISCAEQQMLDAELDAAQRDGQISSPWRDVITRIGHRG